MILTELLETSNFPRRFGRRSLEREIKAYKKKAMRVARAQTRILRRKAVATYRRQYFLNNAYADTRTAVSRNEDIFITGLLAVFILLFSSLNTATNMMLLFLGTAYEIATFTGISMAILILTVGAIIATLCGWIICLLLNMLSIATMDGATRKVKRSSRSTARHGLALAGRITSAWALLGTLLVGPIMLAAITSFWLLQIGAITLAQLLQNVPIIALACITYFVVCLINFSLVPYVALFETKLSLTATFRRSHELVRRRGRIFTLLGYTLFGTTIYASLEFARLADKILHINLWLTFAMLTLIAIVTANCMTVVFYRKRKLARVN